VCPRMRLAYLTQRSSQPLLLVCLEVYLSDCHLNGTLKVKSKNIVWNSWESEPELEPVLHYFPSR
jgi:hypothetical protein